LTEGRKKQNKAGSEVKTFPISSTLEEIQANITIATNTFSKPSKEQLINQALKFHSQGNNLEAAKYYKYFISQGCNDPIVFSNYGIVLKNLGQLKEAENSYHKAIKLNPASPNFHYNLGNVLKDLGRSSEAEISTRKAIELKPDFAEAHLNLGNIFRDLGKLQEAELSTRKAIKQNPSFTNAHLNLGAILQELGKLEEAELSTRKAIKLKPDLAEGHLNLGNIYCDLGKLEQAESSTRKALKLKTDCVDTHIQLGEILFDLGKPEEASIYDWNAIRLDPSFIFLESYQNDLRSIKKIAFYAGNATIFNHYKPIIELNTEIFEILVPSEREQELIHKIRNELKGKEIRIRSTKELLKNKLFYEKLITNTGGIKVDINYKIENRQRSIKVPLIKLFGKKNIRFMYSAGKIKWNLSYWNKYYDGILCYGPYHANRFKSRHKINTAQMGYPRFDKYFNPGFKRELLLEKFNCDPKKKTIVWLPTCTKLSSLHKYLKEITSLRSNYNVVLRPHPLTINNDPENYQKLMATDFNYVDESDDDNVPLFVIADLILLDYGGSMFGALYLKKNFAFLEMNLEAMDHYQLGKMSSEEYLKSSFPDRIANIENIRSIIEYCLENPPSRSILKSIREEFFNTNYQGTSAERAYKLLTSDQWLR